MGESREELKRPLTRHDAVADEVPLTQPEWVGVPYRHGQEGDADDSAGNEAKALPTRKTRHHLSACEGETHAPIT
jgi:hypothetical protein